MISVTLLSGLHYSVCTRLSFIVRVNMCFTTKQFCKHRIIPSRFALPHYSPNYLSSMYLYSTIKVGLPLKHVSISVQYDTRCSSFANTYLMMIHLSSRKLFLKLLLRDYITTVFLHTHTHTHGGNRRQRNIDKDHHKWEA